jgi:hypothetical protein
MLAMRRKRWRKVLAGISALQNICCFGFAQAFARLSGAPQEFMATKREDLTWTLL